MCEAVGSQSIENRECGITTHLCVGVRPDRDAIRLSEDKREHGHSTKTLTMGRAVKVNYANIRRNVDTQ
jgi:hypothetical protein